MRSWSLNDRPTLKELLEIQQLFGLPTPALVEKDWHVVRALSASAAARCRRKGGAASRDPDRDGCVPDAAASGGARRELVRRPRVQAASGAGRNRVRIYRRDGGREARGTDAPRRGRAGRPAPEARFDAGPPCL